MTQPINNTHSNQDDRLADFTDQVLEGGIKQPASNADSDLLGLEETVLRLNKAFPPTPLNDASIKQMHVRLNARMRRESKNVEQPFWKKWFNQDWRYGQLRPQVVMAFAVLALIVVFVIISPSLASAGSSATATALTPSQDLVVGVALAGLILIILWITRRK